MFLIAAVGAATASKNPGKLLARQGLSGQILSERTMAAST
jgi:hypothetical protein